MTDTTTITDLGNGWTRHGQDAVWASGPRGAFIGDPVRDLLRLSMWSLKGQEEPVLRIETSTAAEDDDLADLGELFGSWNSNSVNLPLAALPEMGVIICRILAVNGLLSTVLDRLSEEVDR